MDDPGRLDALDDATLLRRSQQSSAAFRALYDRHVDRLHRFLLRRTGDAATALDLTAETFSRAWLSRERFVDRGEGAAPWLFGIARNVVADSVREHSVQRRARLTVGIEMAAQTAAPSEAWLTGLDEDVEAALADLPDGQRRAVEMRVLDDGGYDDLARDLDISPGAARVRVHRGLAALRRALPARATASAINPTARTRGDLP
jgi:RNA polymerase sigma factor (sigma-70 family)